MRIGENILNLRKNYKLSQEKFAELLGVSRQAVQKWESGESVLCGYKENVSAEECFSDIHKRFDEYSSHDRCHVISNAMIVTAALLYGGGDFGKSVCMAVFQGFDTDCNGATVGSILGMRNGIESMDEKWTKPVNGDLETAIFGFERVSIADMAERTMKHIKI